METTPAPAPGNLNGDWEQSFRHRLEHAEAAPAVAGRPELGYARSLFERGQGLSLRAWKTWPGHRRDQCVQEALDLWLAAESRLTEALAAACADA